MLNLQGSQKTLKCIITLTYFTVFCPLAIHASFIESTVGTAVVNDATATYYNPAALTLLNNSQIIMLGSTGYFRNYFNGEATQAFSQFTQSGSSHSEKNYYLPSLYVGIPTKNKITFGIAIVSNFLNSEIEENSILRYSQSNSSIQNIDVVPAIGVKLNDYFSIGAGINISYAHFLLQPTVGFPSLNTPDTQSRNDCTGSGLGEEIGFLLKPSQSTLIGFNYRSAITYPLSGISIFESTPEVISNNYNFRFWTPARSVLSINHMLTPTLGLISTVQRIQWSIFKNININGIATQIGSQPLIVNTSVPFHLHDTWLLTLGSHYRITPKWTIRIASSYNQSVANGHFQISNGDSITLGTSMSYKITPHITIDGSYAHAFIQNKDIHIATGRNIVNGANKGVLDAFSLKLTYNV